MFSYLLHGRGFCACLPVLKSVWLEKDTRILTSALYSNQESALEKWESISCPESAFHPANLGEEQMVGGHMHTMLLFLSQIRLYPPIPELGCGDTGQTSFSSQTSQTVLHHPHVGFIATTIVILIIKTCVAQRV